MMNFTTRTPIVNIGAGGEEDQEDIMNKPPIKVFFLLLYIIVFFACLLGNSIILVVIIVNRSMRTLTNFFLANLAVADLLVGIFCVCQNAAHFVLFEHGTWPFGAILCHAYVYILHMIPNSSAGILVLLSVERFIAVLRPMLVQTVMTRSVLFLCAMLVWAFSALMNLPYLFAVQFLEMTDPESGFLLWNDMNILQIASMVNLLLWYVVPLTTLLCIYLSIGLVLIKTTVDDGIAMSAHQQDCRQNPHKRLNNTLSAHSNYSAIRRASEARFEVVDSRRRAIRLCVVLVVAFAALSLPRYLYLTWSVWRDRDAPRCVNCLAALIQPATFLCIFINSAINPMLYAFLSRRFRTAIQETFACSGKRKHNKKQIELQQFIHGHKLSEHREKTNGWRNSNDTKGATHLTENFLTEENNSS